jgi:general stress protein YciG
MPSMREQQKDAGKKGGTTTRERHGVEHFRAAGKKGGQAAREKLGAEHFREAGKKGGRTTASQPGALRRAAALGGKATVERLGKEHFQRIGAAGAKSRMERAAQGPRLLAALEPFRRYLEATEADYLHMQPRGLATEKTSAPLHPASCGVTFGACLALLQQMRLAHGPEARQRGSRVGEPGGESRAWKAGVEALRAGAEKVKDLTVELDPEAVASGRE